MRILFNQSVLLLLLMTGFIMQQAVAAKLPAGYPRFEEFQNTGTIDSVDIKTSRIVVNDQEYQTRSNVIVVLPGKKNATLKSLKIGSVAGIFFSSGDTDSQPTATEIWVFPRNFK